MLRIKFQALHLPIAVLSISLLVAACNKTPDVSPDALFTDAASRLGESETAVLQDYYGYSDKEIDALGDLSGIIELSDTVSLNGQTASQSVQFADGRLGMTVYTVSLSDTETIWETLTACYDALHQLYGEPGYNREGIQSAETDTIYTLYTDYDGFLSALEMNDSVANWTTWDLGGNQLADLEVRALSEPYEGDQIGYVRVRIMEHEGS